ncbi:MAG: hypothetical protein ABDH37_07955 [Candidatus Hydrothermales bacterium]
MIKRKSNLKIKKILSYYLSQVDNLKHYCDRCLKTERWGGNVCLMIIDAAFTSIGLNYFTAVVPKVFKFKEDFVDKGMIKNLCDLANFDYKKAFYIWRNERSWHVIKEISKYLCELKNEKGLSDKEALRTWAKNADTYNFKKDPIGKIKGVGLVTFEYLKMMGGIDTVMPDKIVKRVLNKIFKEGGLEEEEDNLKFIEKVKKISNETGIRCVEMCWMTWLIQKEGNNLRTQKYKKIMDLI